MKLRKYHQETDALQQRINKLLPGLLMEQAAAVLLENINIFVMAFVSTAALAGVGQVNTINNTLMNLFQAFAIGGTVMTAQGIGANDNRRAGRAAGQAILLGFTFSMTLTLIMFFWQTEIITGLYGKADADVLESSYIFFSYSLFTPPLWFLYFQCCGIMRSCGNAMTPMIISVILNTSSTILNLVFVLWLDMGAAGTGLALLLAVLIAACISLCVLLSPKFPIRILQPISRDSIDEMKKVLFVAFPSAIENLLFNGSKVILQFFIAGMGTVMISANQVFNSVSAITSVPFMALYYLVIPIVAQEAGSGKREAVCESLQRVYKMGYRWCLVLGILEVVLAYPLCFLFTRDMDVLRIGAHMMLIYGVCMMFQPASYILPNGFKGVGDVRFAMTFSSITAWTIRVGGTWILGIWMGLGVYALAITQCADMGVRGLAYHLRYKSRKWLHEIKEENDDTSSEKLPSDS